MSSTWTVPSYSEDWTVPGYTEVREVGHGTSGKVVQAVHDESGQTVAIKYLSHMLVHDPAFIWRFRADAQMLRELSVPQVVQVYDYVEQPGQGAAIIMELVNGVSLHQLIERQGPTAPEAACTVLKDALLGLAAAHTLGILHRDYKPENVIVDSAGYTKLVDFGVAVRWGKQAPAAGTPLYMAPEQWHEAPASPAADIYAATAVFYECLTGKPPFSGKLLGLQEQHMTASVPLERIDEPLRNLVAQGMAKNPAGRPPSAIAFVPELEAMATSVYGPYWEEHGRSELAERSGAILPLLLRDNRTSASARSYASTWEGGGKSRVITVAAITAVIVVAIGAVAGAVVLKGNGNSQANLSGNSTPQTVTATQPTSYTAVANVTPPVRATTCTAPSTFSYNATVSATGKGTMKYQWVYSSGKPGPVQTLNFTGAGKKVVTGETLSLMTASTGWGKINMISPSKKTLDEASYQLLCSKGNNSRVNASASVQVPSGTVICGSPVPTLTATGSVSDAKAGVVTYYWAQSDGVKSAPATLDFTAPGTLAVAPLRITPAGDPGTGEAVLVVTSPVTAASSPATYTLSCTPKPTPSPSKTSPAPTTSAHAPTTPAPTTPAPTTPAPTTPAPTKSSPAATPATSSSSAPAPTKSSPAATPATSSSSAPAPSKSSPAATTSATASSPSPTLTVSSSPATKAPVTPTLTASAPASPTVSISPTASATGA